MTCLCPLAFDVVGNYAGAHRTWQQALTLRPNDVKCVWNFALSRYRAGLITPMQFRADILYAADRHDLSPEEALAMVRAVRREEGYDLSGNGGLSTGDQAGVGVQAGDMATHGALSDVVVTDITKTIDALAVNENTVTQGRGSEMYEDMEGGHFDTADLTCDMVIVPKLMHLTLNLVSQITCYAPNSFRSGAVSQRDYVSPEHRSVLLAGHVVVEMDAHGGYREFNCIYECHVPPSGANVWFTFVDSAQLQQQLVSLQQTLGDSSGISENEELQDIALVPLRRVLHRGAACMTPSHMLRTEQYPQILRISDVIHCPGGGEVTINRLLAVDIARCSSHRRGSYSTQPSTPAASKTGDEKVFEEPVHTRRSRNGDRSACATPSPASVSSVSTKRDGGGGDSSGKSSAGGYGSEETDMGMRHQFAIVCEGQGQGVLLPVDSG